MRFFGLGCFWDRRFWVLRIVGSILSREGGKVSWAFLLLACFFFSFAAFGNDVML